MQQDQSRQSERAAIGIETVVRDAQVWKAHTKIEKLWIPESLKGSKAFSKIHDLDKFCRMGHDALVTGGKLQTIGSLQRDILLEEGIEPEILEIPSNLLMYGGASCQWQTLIGNGTATAGQALTFFSNAQAAIGVGDSTTAAVATHTDLQAATNKLRVAMDATYPVHTDGVVVGAASILFKSTFSTAQANWAWQEWGVFNSPTAATGRMLQRKVESLGTKTAASTWALTLTLSLG